MDRDEQQLDRAYQAGQRQAEMGATIASHEKRLNAINGSIDRGVKRTEELTQKIDAISSQLTTNNAVANALGKSVQDAAERQISARGFYFATFGVVLTMIGVIATILEVVHV